MPGQYDIQPVTDVESGCLLPEDIGRLEDEQYHAGFRPAATAISMVRSAATTPREDSVVGLAIAPLEIEPQSQTIAQMPSVEEVVEQLPRWLQPGRPQLTAFADIMQSGEAHECNPRMEEIWDDYRHAGRAIQEFALRALHQARVAYLAARQSPMVTRQFVQGTIKTAIDLVAVRQPHELVPVPTPEERWGQHYAQVLSGLEARVADIDRELTVVIAGMIGPNGHGDSKRLALKAELAEIDTPAKRQHAAYWAAYRHAHTYALREQIAELASKFAPRG